MKRSLAWILSPISAAAIAADLPQPFAGFAYRETGASWVHYLCSPDEGETITCDFTQVLIRKESEESDVYRRVQEGLADEPPTDEQMGEFCALADSVVAAVRGDTDGTGEDVAATVAGWNDLQRRDATRQFASVAAYCEERTPERLADMLRADAEKDTRTCIVSTNQFKQSFRPVLGSDGSLISWVVADNSPDGECGFVQMSRFLPITPIKGSSFQRWQYVAKRATSNPEASTVLGMSCRDFEEFEQVFDWKSKEMALGCDYLKAVP